MRIVLNEARKAYRSQPYITYKVTKFLFIPKCINGEFRWLETSTWVRKPTYSYKHSFSLKERYYWNDIEWCEEEKQCV